jgi:hypothetical protein
MDRKRGNGESADEIVRIVNCPIDKSAGKGLSTRLYSIPLNLAVLGHSICHQMQWGV